MNIEAYLKGGKSVCPFAARSSRLYATIGDRPSEKDISKFPQRQAWGWSSFETGLGVDVLLPKGKKLDLHGADYSTHLAEVAAERVATGLCKLGYAVRIGELSQ